MSRSRRRLKLNLETFKHRLDKIWLEKLWLEQRDSKKVVLRLRLNVEVEGGGLRLDVECGGLRHRLGFKSGWKQFPSCC